MCPQYDCPKRQSCYRYTAIPNGRRQSYMMGKGFIGDECTHFTENEKELDEYEIKDIDKRNRDMVSKWMGVEFE